MRTFEVGKRYGEHAVVFEIVKRTAKNNHIRSSTARRKIQREKRRAKDSESKKLGRQRSIFHRKPDSRSVRQARVAQWIAQQPSKPPGAGSSPVPCITGKATINSYQIQGGIPHESIINYQS